MKLCDGWIKVPHNVDGDICHIYIEGCWCCGGADCGDSGNSLYMCKQCLLDLIDDESLTGHYTIMDDNLAGRWGIN